MNESTLDRSPRLAATAEVVAVLDRALQQLERGPCQDARLTAKEAISHLERVEGEVPSAFRERAARCGLPLQPAGVPG